MTGRAANICPPAKTDHAVLAIDIGGTKLATAVVDASGELLGAQRMPTLRTADAEALFTALLGLCHEAVQQAGQDVVGVGVGCGGPMRYPAGIVSPLNIPAWRDFPLRDRLSASFGLPCRVDNDAKAMTLGERWRGAGRGSNNMLGMVVSTGVGGGIILDGQLRHGHRGNAGHVGHIVVKPGGPPCGCGGHGCVEAIASGTGLANRLALEVARGAITRLASGASAADIAAAAREGDPLSVELFRDAGEALGRCIASAAAVLDLEVVVLGGSIALRAWDLLAPTLTSTLRQEAKLDFTRDVRVVQAELGDAAGLVGAAQLAFTLL